jgi:hypothetical protein
MDRRTEAPSPVLYDNRKAKIESLRQRGFDNPFKLIMTLTAVHHLFASVTYPIAAHASARYCGTMAADAAVDHDGPGNARSLFGV